jgi:L-threonylcarbamoyladenylate synthase
MSAALRPVPTPPRRWRWDEPLEPLRRALAGGGVLALPTESSYGLGADPRDARGVAAIYRLKGRARGQALPVVAADLEQLAVLGVAVDEPLFQRLATVWPAPVSLVVAARCGLPAAAGGDTLAVRLPGHPRLLRLLRELGLALTATSANRSGEPPVTDPAELSDLLGSSDAVIVDDGRLAGGPASTMLAIDGRRLTLLRRGRYPIADLRRRFPELPIAAAPGV